MSKYIVNKVLWEKDRSLEPGRYAGNNQDLDQKYKSIMLSESQKLHLLIMTASNLKCGIMNLKNCS